MRTLESHKGDPVNDAITIDAHEAPECYDVSAEYGLRRRLIGRWLTNEALLAIVADRLECVQSGEIACEENHQALSHISIALRKLKQRHARATAESTEGAA